MLRSEWLHFQYLLMDGFFVISIALNICLIVLILFKSPKNLGPYKHLMKFISFFEIFYSFTDWLILPVMHAYGCSFFIMTIPSESIFDKSQALVMQAVWCGCFGTSMAIFGIHFVYRYLAVIGSPYISTFKGFKIFVWLMIPIVYGIIWGGIAYTCCFPKDILTEYIRKTVKESFDVEVEEVVYLGPYFYTAAGDFHVDADVLITSAGIIGIIGSSLLTIFYFGSKCYLSLTNIPSIAGHSAHYRSLQRQFFTALVLQTVIPITLMHLPLLVNYSSALLNSGLGKVSNVASITIALYPAIDPLPTIFIVKNYRIGLKDFCLWPKRALAKALWSHETATGRSSTAFDNYNDAMLL